MNWKRWVCRLIGHGKLMRAIQRTVSVDGERVAIAPIMATMCMRCGRITRSAWDDASDH